MTRLISPLKKILFFGAILICCSNNTNAQQQNLSKQRLHKATANSFLYGGKYGNNSLVSVQEFDTLLTKHLEVKDTANRSFYARSFSFVYINRGLYSDEVGKPVILSDHHYMSSDRGVLPDFWVKGLKSQLKAGDTAIFTDIRYKADTSKYAPNLYSKTLRIILKN